MDNTPPSNRIIQGDVLDVLRGLPDGFVQTVVTSPPYFGLRDYGVEGQIGLEETPALFVEKMVEVFAEVRRVLKDDGTLWLNLGDSYNAYNGNAGPASTLSKRQSSERPKFASGYGLRFKGLKPKDLIGVPWRVALALQEAGWYLRADVIWAKPNPMPESMKDRPTKAHEYIFLMAKSQRYFYDAAAIAEPVTASTVSRVTQPGWDFQAGSDRVPGKTNGPMKAVIGGEYEDPAEARRNVRSVWSIVTMPYKEAHFATFPEEIPKRCILAGSRRDDLVLDVFSGSGTVAAVAKRHGRRYLGIELNPAYIEISERRLAAEPPPHPEFPGLEGP